MFQRAWAPTPPSVLPDISPTRGEIGKWRAPCSKSLPLFEFPEIQWRNVSVLHPISPLWGRCPAGQRGVLPSASQTYSAAAISRSSAMNSTPSSLRSGMVLTALVRAERPAGLQRDHPVVQRAGDGLRMHDALRERAALVRAMVVDGENPRFPRCERRRSCLRPSRSIVSASAEPFEQSRPWFAGWSGSPLTETAPSSATVAMTPQPTPQ